MGSQHADRAQVNTCLYERLGGDAILAAVVDDAFDRHAANPALATLFCGKDLPQLKALGVSVFSTIVGGPFGIETGGPELPYAGMRFSPEELQAVVGDLTAALQEQGIGTVEVEEIVRLLYTNRVALPPC